MRNSYISVRLILKRRSIIKVWHIIVCRVIVSFQVGAVPLFHWGRWQGGGG